MEKKLRSRLIQVLRREFLYSQHYKQALKKAEALKGYYKCAKCEKHYPKSNINIDHIEPVVELTGFVDFNTFISRLFTDNLQCLCLECHKIKTGTENKVRVKAPFNIYGELQKFLPKKKRRKKS